MNRLTFTDISRDFHIGSQIVEVWAAFDGFGMIMRDGHGFWSGHEKGQAPSGYFQKFIAERQHAVGYRS